MQVYNPFTQEKTDTRTTLPVNRIFRTLLRLIETVENLLHVFCHNTVSRITYIHIEQLLSAFTLNGCHKYINATTIGRKLNGIRNQINQHLTHISGINHQERILQSEISAYINLPLLCKNSERYQQLR